MEVKVKTHLIITDIHEEYSVKWCGRINEVNPKFINNKLCFAITGGRGRVEVNTNNMKELEERAKRMTYPRGRGALTVDKAFIYIIEKDDSEKLFCVVTHNHITKYAPMYDTVGYY